MKRLTNNAERIIAGVALSAGFLLMASVFVPDLSEARPGSDTPAEETIEAPSTNPHAGLLTLGSIEDDQYRVDVYGGAEGPLYSVYDAATGRELGVLLTGEQAAEWFPDLPIPQMDFGTDPHLMFRFQDPDA